jgi:hypothetical protein
VSAEGAQQQVIAHQSTDGTPSAIGGFLSTSNHLKEEQVTITAEGEIIWTVEMRHD